MTIQQQRQIIRRLADTWMDEVAKPVHRQRARLWAANNDLKPERPMVWITELPWLEVERQIEELTPQCTDPELLAIERKMRRKLFTAKHLMTDEVLDPYWKIDYAIEGADFGIETEEERIVQKDADIQSHHYNPVITDFDDIEKIKIADIRHNTEETLRRIAYAESLFGDIMPIKAGPSAALNFFSPWDALVCWTGVTEALMDLYERPDFIHAIMRRLTDSILARQTQLESLGLLACSNNLERVGSGGAGYTDQLPQPDLAPGKLRFLDCWSFSAAQIFCDVSPEMHSEFALAYEIEFLSRCGLNYYGCCEPLHNKMQVLKAVPNLRKISISPWCKTDLAAERAAQKYVFSHKLNPAILAADVFDESGAKADIISRLEMSGDMPCEFIMKDVSTIRGDIKRVIAWCEIASRVCENWR